MFNKLFNFTQNHTQFLYNNSLLLQNIDKLIYISILAVFVASTVMKSDYIGVIALFTTFLTIVKLLFVKGEELKPSKAELWLLAYFMIVIISLAGSSLFVLSFKGFLKTLTYMGFYLSIAHFLRKNTDKILPMLVTIGLCVSFEGIIGFLQNVAHVEEISTWQDVSKLNPEEVMTRVYGTLKPYNPNLLGGYFVAGIPALYASSAVFLTEKKYPFGIAGLILSLISTAALFLTGCRGSYIGMLVILAGTFAVSAKYFWQNYKAIYTAIVGGCVALITSAILLSASLRARVLSMFAMRQDSSNSFRFNVYQSSFNMFKENWLLGIGVGNKNFREIYGLYMRTGFDALSAYNIFLEIAVESGIFALIAFLGFIGTMLAQGIKIILKSTEIRQVIFLSAAVISILAMMVHGLVDTVFFRPQIQFIFWTMCAIVTSIHKNSEM